MPADDDSDDALVPAQEALVIADEERQLALSDPDQLIRVFRFLQQHIPEFVQLSAEEERALIRAASLDPEFLEAGVRTGAHWDDAKSLIGLSGEELRELAEENRRWDALESAAYAFWKGVASTNRQRHHRLGTAVLDMYAILRRSLTRHPELRPHFEEMQRAYRNRKVRQRGKKKEERD